MTDQRIPRQSGPRRSRRAATLLGACVVATMVAVTAAAMAIADSSDRPDPSSPQARQNQLRSSLTDERLSEDGRRSIEEKLQIEEREATALAADKSNKETAGPGPVDTGVEDPRDPVDRGIVEDNEAPFSSAEFVATSHWGGKVGDRTVVVYAGQAGSGDEKTGVLRTVVVGDDGPGLVKTFPEAGALRIVAATDETLTTLSATGKETDVPLRSLLP